MSTLRSRVAARGRVVRLVHLRQIRLHPLRSFAAVVSVAAGIAMVLAVTVVNASTEASFRERSEALAGPASIRVTGPLDRGGIQADVVDRIRAEPGVLAAVPMVQGVVVSEPTGGAAGSDAILLLGLDCVTAEALGTDCATLATTPAVSTTLDPAIAPLVLRTDIGAVPVQAQVVPALDRLGTDVLVAPIETVSTWLARGGAVDVVNVVASGDVPEGELLTNLSEALGPQFAVRPTSALPAALATVLGTIIPLFGLLGLFSLGVGVVLVVNAITLSLEERRREFAVVAALGGDSSAVVGGALLQAAVLGAAGGLLGAVLALALSYPLTASVSQYTVEVGGVEVAAQPGQTPIGLAVIVGIGVAVLSAIRPARRARRMDVAAELSNRDRRSESSAANTVRGAIAATAVGLAGTGVAVLGGEGGSLDPWQPRAALIGLLAAIGGFAMAASRTAPLIAGLVQGRLRRRGGTLGLALGNLVKEPARTGVMALAVGAAVGTAFVVASFATSAKAGITDGVTADLAGVVSLQIEGGDGSVHSRVPPAVLDVIRARPDVASVAESSFLIVGEEKPIAVEGTEHVALGTEVYRGTADAAAFARGEVLVGAALARSFQIEPGDSLPIPVPSGIREVHVQGVWANGNFVGNSVLMPLWLMEDLFGPQPVDGVLVSPRPGIVPGELAAAIESAGYDSALRAETALDVADDVAAGVESQLAPFWALQRSLTLVAFIAVASTLLLVGIQRTRELGLLAALGMEPRVMARMVLTEAAIVGVIGAIVGSVMAFGLNISLGAIVPMMIGWQNPYRFALWTLPLYGVVTVIVAVAGAVPAAWRASRTTVIEALSYE